MTSAQAIKAIEELGEQGWHVKLMLDRESRPTPTWRVWLGWRKGEMPHKEESTRTATLIEAAEWCTTTAETWEYDDA